LSIWRSSGTRSPSAPLRSAGITFVLLDRFLDLRAERLIVIRSSEERLERAPQRAATVPSPDRLSPPDPSPLQALRLIPLRC